MTMEKGVMLFFLLHRSSLWISCNTGRGGEAENGRKKADGGLPRAGREATFWKG